MRPLQLTWLLALGTLVSTVAPTAACPDDPRLGKLEDAVVHTS